MKRGIVHRVHRMRMLPKKLPHGGTPSGTVGLTRPFGRETSLPQKETVRRLLAWVGIEVQRGKNLAEKTAILLPSVVRSFTKVIQERLRSLANVCS